MPSPPRQASEGGAVAEALLLAARARFGHHLTPGEVQEVKKGIDSVLRSGDEAAGGRRSSNADEPVGIFEARPRGARGAGRR